MKLNRIPQIGDYLALKSLKHPEGNEHYGLCCSLDEMCVTIACERIGTARVSHKPLSTYRLNEVEIKVVKRPRKKRYNPLEHQTGLPARRKKR